MNKIFVVGFPKAGTTSIHQAIKDAGFRSIHWGWPESPKHLPCHAIRFGKKITSIGMMMRYAKENNMPLLSFVNDFDAYAQMDITLGGDLNYWPQLTDVPLLDKQYPESKFIFNTRPLDKWTSSINRWGDLKLRLTKADLPGLPEGVGYRDEELIDWHNWHKQNMCDYFKDKEAQFLVFDIERDDPKVLGRFLHIKKIKFGHLNANNRTVL